MKVDNCAQRRARSHRHQTFIADHIITHGGGVVWWWWVIDTGGKQASGQSIVRTIGQNITLYSGAGKVKNSS